MSECSLNVINILVKSKSFYLQFTQGGTISVGTSSTNNI